MMLHWYKNEIDKQKDVINPTRIKRQEELEKRNFTNKKWSRNSKSIQLKEKLKLILEQTSHTS